MFDVRDRFAKQDIMRRRRQLRLPHSASFILREGLAKLRKMNRSVSWGLPETPFSDEVLNYYQRHNSLQLSGPRPKLRRALDDSFAEEQAIKIDAGLSFAALAESADPLVRPILLYYSCMHFCGVFTRAFFDWENDNRSHGLACRHCHGNVSNTEIEVNNGQFPRLVATCFLLDGQPSCFSTLVTYSAKPMFQTGPGELLENFCKREQGNPIKNISLDQLVNFDFGAALSCVRQHHGFNKFKFLPSTAFLIDVISLFVGSSIARYNVLGWRNILEGRDNSYRVHFEETYERFQTYTIDALLAILEDPSRTWGKPLFLSVASPYSHRDHYRFKDDPNAQ